MNFLILPNQLFNKSYLDKKYTYYIWEHSHYFKKYKYNKKKIILHKSSMVYYFTYLKKILWWAYLSSKAGNLS